MVHIGSHPLNTLDRVKGAHWFTYLNDIGPCKRVHIGSHTLMTLVRVKGLTLVHIHTLMTLDRVKEITMVRTP